MSYLLEAVAYLLGGAAASYAFVRRFQLQRNRDRR